MTKKKPLLGLYIIISLVIIVVAAVLALTVGIRVGSDIGGGTQFEVNVSGENSKEQMSKIKKVLSRNGISVEKIFLEDKGVDKEIIVRVARKDLDENLRNDIAAELEIDVENVSEFSAINGLVTKRNVLWTSIAIICILLLIFVLGWIRYKLMAGFTLTFSVLHALLLSVSALIITRLPITFVSLVSILSTLCLVLFALILTLERIRENAKLKHNENLDAFELVDMSKKSTLKPLIFLGALLVFFALIIMCIPFTYITFSALTFIVCLVACAYSYYFVGMGIHANLLDIKMIRDKQRISKNPEDAKKKDSKKGEPKEKKVDAEKKKAKEDKAKDKQMKEKMKARKEKESKKDQPVV